MANEFIDSKTVFRMNLKTAALCVFKTIISALLCFIIYVSITMMAVSLGTKVIGYTVYHSTDSNNYTVVYKHFLSDGTDKRFEQYANNKEYFKMNDIRSELGNGPRQVIALTSQILGLILFVSMLYGTTWKLGDGDENKSTFGHMDKDMFRGLKIGLWSVLPYSLVWLLLLFSKLGLTLSSFPVQFKILNYHFFYINDLILGSATKSAAHLSWSGTLLPLLLLIPLPLILSLGYIAGYRHFSIKEKIIYQKPAARK